jgi:antigen flippase
MSIDLSYDPVAPTAPVEPSRGRALAGTTAATIVIVACGLISGMLTARGRGQLAAIVVWASMLVYAGTLGLPEAVGYFAASNPAGRNRVWITGQAMAVALGLLITVTGWWVVPIAFSSHDTVLAQSIRWYLLFFSIPALGSLCACAWLQSQGAMHAFNISRSAIHIVNTGGIVILFLAGSHSVARFAAVLLIGNAATWILAVALGPSAAAFAAQPSMQLARRILHYGVRVQFGAWSSVANVRLDQLLLAVFAPTASLGVYVVAVSYAGVLQTVPSSAALVMLPDIVRASRLGGADASVEQWYRRVLWTTLVCASVIALSSVWAVPALFGGAFASAVPLMVLLVPAVVILGMNQILSTAFRGIGRPEVGSASEIIGLAVTVPALAILLPRYGIYGAAAASLLAYGATHAYLVRKAAGAFGVGLKSLCVLRREDLVALRELSGQGRQWLTRSAAEATHAE